MGPARTKRSARVRAAPTCSGRVACPGGPGSLGRPGTRLAYDTEARGCEPQKANRGVKAGAAAAAVSGRARQRRPSRARKCSKPSGICRSPRLRGQDEASRRRRQRADPGDRQAGEAGGGGEAPAGAAGHREEQLVVLAAGQGRGPARRRRSPSTAATPGWMGSAAALQPGPGAARLGHLADGVGQAVAQVHGRRRGPGPAGQRSPGAAGARAAGSGRPRPRWPGLCRRRRLRRAAARPDRPRRRRRCPTRTARRRAGRRPGSGPCAAWPCPRPSTSMTSGPGDRVTLPPTRWVPVRAASARKPSRSASSSASGSASGSISDSSAVRGSAPIAARSLRLAARTRWPIAPASMKRRLKWTPSTAASVVTTSSRLRAGSSTAASSPMPTTTNGRRRRHPRPNVRDHLPLADLTNRHALIQDSADAAVSTRLASATAAAAGAATPPASAPPWPRRRRAARAPGSAAATMLKTSPKPSGARRAAPRRPGGWPGSTSSSRRREPSSHVANGPQRRRTARDTRGARAPGSAPRPPRRGRRSARRTTAEPRRPRRPSERSGRIEVEEIVGADATP